MDHRSGNLKLSGFGRAGFWNPTTGDEDDFAYAPSGVSLKHSAPEVSATTFGHANDLDIPSRVFVFPQFRGRLSASRPRLYRALVRCVADKLRMQNCEYFVMFPTTVGARVEFFVLVGQGKIF